jgi:hypothetical protein
MNEAWYGIVPANAPITQGDIIFDCPLVGWKVDTLEIENIGESETLQSLAVATAADVVVMTQACDLEHNKVSNIILCPHVLLEDYRQLWTNEMERQNQNPTEKAWRKNCDDICDGFVWNLTMLNNFKRDDINIDIRIVDFREIFAVPREFLESLLVQRGRSRPRLLPPYREHLSQAFARFFMRVGLPTPIQKVW